MGKRYIPELDAYELTGEDAMEALETTPLDELFMKREHIEQIFGKPPTRPAKEGQHDPRRCN